MIQINDSDTPIMVAQKIIHGTKPRDSYTPAMKAIVTALTGNDSDEAMEVDMFDDAEVREIADYLMVYCKYQRGEE